MAKPEARRFKRVALRLPAYITINAGEEIEGALINISPGGMALIADAETAPGDAATVRIKDLDVIDGTVARTFPDGFAISFLLSKQRRARLTEKLMIAANDAHAEGLGDRRKSLRHQDGHTRMMCRLDDGASLFAKVVDISVDGVSLDAPRRPSVGAEIHVGRRRGVVIRHTSRGFVVVYRAADAAGAAANLRRVV